MTRTMRHLTEADRAEILRRYEDNETMKHIAEVTGASRTNVFNVVHGIARKSEPTVKRTRVERQVAPVFCRGCRGYINVVPCRLCEVRNQ